MEKQIYIINGPNLNLLGKRQTEIYGSQSFEDYLQQLEKRFPKSNIQYYQSNVEGELINKLQEIGFSDCGIILNAGAYTHTSIGIADAISSITAEVIEVHISQPLAREKERQHSLISKVCKGSISGFGLDSYTLAMHFFIDK